MVAFAVEEIPPFKMAGIRFLSGSILIFIIVAITKGWKHITKKQYINSAIAGILFLAIGNGGMSFALQYIDSGYSCLLTSSQPLILLLMLWLIDKQAPPSKAWIGVLLGIVGMFLLVSEQGLIESDKQVLGTIVIFGCLLSWGIGSIFVNRSDLPKSYLTNTGIQMFIGGIFLMVVSRLLNEAPTDWATISTRAYFSLGVLIIFGSVIAFTAFNYLLVKVSPEKVATATYINPLVALTLGYYFRDELITNQIILAAGILLIGVYFINTNKHKNVHAEV
jgi:drug/metabolite transporter (DMT)-like permease